MVRHGESSKSEGNERTRGLTEKGNSDARIEEIVFISDDQILPDQELSPASPQEENAGLFGVGIWMMACH
jgi:hypothetical protein